MDAVQTLKNLVGQGVLYIVTNVPTGGRSISDLTEEELRQARSFVCHAVTSVEGPNEKGIMTAYSAEGDWCMGKPEALLRRLLEYTNEQVENA